MASLIVLVSKHKYICIFYCCYFSLEKMSTLYIDTFSSEVHPLCNKTLFLVMLQNIFHAVVEVPRWTNAKMEVCLCWK